jgi:glycosyltransferase involved in cell wall biosynthesis
MYQKPLVKTPLVSIVTPSYNMGKYIGECIESVLKQDYPRIEHIIYDGKSADQTKEILKKYQSRKYWKKIKIFIEKDKGQIDGLNKAIQKTRGDILLMLNADDQLMPYAVTWGVEYEKVSRYCSDIW